MQYIGIIQSSIDYIEKNLKTQLTAEELAKQAGFSLFHYYRIFQNAVGMPVMQYVQKRKQINGIYEISQGNKMIDIASSLSLYQVVQENHYFIYGLGAS